MSYRNYKNREDIQIRKPVKRKKKTKAPKLPPIDKNLLTVVLLLIIFGIVAIWSASAPEGVANFQNPLYYPLRHIFYAAIGFFCMRLTASIHYKKWEKWVDHVTFITIGLIVLTLVPGIGVTSYGASRWINLGFIQLQPSELAKFACILLVTTGICGHKSLWNPVAKKHMLFVAIILGVIVLQPNMSMIILLLTTMFGMLVVSGINMKIMLPFALVAIPVLGYKIMHTGYQSSRITGWLNPYADPQGAGYNIIQSWYAISSGGLLGVGLGNSKQKLYYLPVGYTDFVFSVIAEELGFIGIVGLIILFLFFIHFGFRVAIRCKDNFGKLLAFGIVFNIGSQAFINMCVASGVFPVTGVTLPLISYGGSSLIATFAMIGVLFNISRYANKKEQTQEIGQLQNAQ